MHLDKVIIVTGASGGLGREITRYFLTLGARVIGVARTREKLLHSLSDISEQDNQRLFPFTADISHWEEALLMQKEAVKRFKRIDGLVHTVGGFKAGKAVAETTEEEWETMMVLNLKSAFLCSKAVWPIMQDQKAGKILTISALAAIHPKANRGAYQVSKSGLIALIKSLALEGKEHNIQVNSIAPSVIETEANKKAMPQAESSKWVRPEEIAKLAAFLCSNDSDDISGTVVEMPGKM